MVKRVVISGCSGGGKSSLLADLSSRGFCTFAEPGRTVVTAELAADGDGLPWVNEHRFAGLVMALGVRHWTAATSDLCFYDRSLVDVVTWYERQSATVPQEVAALVRDYPYANKVFLTPPWPEIYVNDAARRHSFEDAVAEYNALLESYPAKGYEVVIVPKMGIEQRADWLLDRIKEW